MSANHWIAGISGNWDDDANWSGGVPTSAQAVAIGAVGTYTVTLSDAEAANAFEMNSANATLSETGSGTLTTGGAFGIEAGTVILRHANNFGSGVTQTGGLLEISKGGALGTGTYVLGGGKFVGLAKETVTADFSLSGDSTVAAAHGKTVTLANSGGWQLTGPATVTFGDTTNDGTIVWGGSSGAINGSYSIVVRDGVLEDGAVTLSGMLYFATTTTVAAHGTLDAAGYGLTVNDLVGAGTVTNTASGAATLALANAAFGGAITGNLALSVGNAGYADLTGASTYTGGTTIGGTSGELRLGNGGTTGSIAGSITDNGYLDIDRSNTVNLTNKISGTGVLSLIGKGTTVIDHANTYGGGTQIHAGTLSVDRASAIGTGGLALSGGTFLTTKNLTLNNALDISGKSTIAAAHGTKLTVTSGWTVETGSHLTFGAKADNGTILWADSAPGTVTAGTYAVTLAGGTLEPRSATSYLGVILSGASKVSIAAGATLDINGYSDVLEAANVTGSGTITNGSSTASAFSFDGTNTDFAGKITGKLSVYVNNNGTAVLTGNSTYTGTTLVSSDATLVLGDGGKTGAVKGTINLDSGALLIADHSGTFDLANKISGAGALQIRGNGTTVIDHSNSFTGGTIVDGGTLSIDRASALGTGAVAIDNGELIATKSFTFANSLTVSGVRDTIAAGHGQTLSVNPADVESKAIVFGDSTHDGTIKLSATGTSLLAGYQIEVAAGTLAAADSGFYSFTEKSGGVAVDSGAALVLGNYDAAAGTLSGSGTITGSSGTSLEIGGGSFAGHINGGLSLGIDNAVTLSGGGNFSGGATLDDDATLTLKNAAAEDVTFTGTSHLVLDTPNSYTGTLHGFTGADTLDLTNIAHNSHFELSFAHHKLTVTDGHHTDVIAFAGSYTASSFHASSDGHGGTLIKDPPAGGHDDALIQALADHASHWFDTHSAATDFTG